MADVFYERFVYDKVRDGMSCAAFVDHMALGAPVTGEMRITWASHWQTALNKLRAEDDATTGHSETD